MSGAASGLAVSAISRCGLHHVHLQGIMEFITTARELSAALSGSGNPAQVGFVPTMGALHQGHISLVERAVRENETVVVSIFVNPTQFNNISDLELYPRTLEADLKLLEATGCRYVFAPSVEEIYPEPDNRKFDFGNLGMAMEGQFRPGHFNGVAQVVSRLFSIVEPSKAYFGLKDFQQLAIIREMVRQLHLPVEIVPCEIVREQGGLAMSSRNERLSAEGRRNASRIYQVLSGSENLTGSFSVADLAAWITREINKNPFLSVEYVEIVDETTLGKVIHWQQPGRKVVCVAVWCENVRLIDNFIIN